MCVEMGDRARPFNLQYRARSRSARAFSLLRDLAIVLGRVGSEGLDRLRVSVGWSDIVRQAIAGSPDAGPSRAVRPPRCQFVVDVRIILDVTSWTEHGGSLHDFVRPPAVSVEATLRIVLEPVHDAGSRCSVGMPVSPWSDPEKLLPGSHGEILVTRDARCRFAVKVVHRSMTRDPAFGESLTRWRLKAEVTISFPDCRTCCHQRQRQDPKRS